MYELDSPIRKRYNQIVRADCIASMRCNAICRLEGRCGWRRNVPFLWRGLRSVIARGQLNIFYLRLVVGLYHVVMFQDRYYSTNAGTAWAFRSRASRQILTEQAGGTGLLSADRLA